MQKDCPPTIDITAAEDGKDTEIKIFSKYLEIIYKDIPTKNIGVKVEGGEDFPELQVPQQDMPFLLETTVAGEASHRRTGKANQLTRTGRRTQLHRIGSAEHFSHLLLDL